MGAYQPNHTWAGRKRHPRGEVYEYRMSLWAEHLGLEDVFLRRQTVECVLRINQLAEQNWKAYISDENNEMQGHLIKYPLKVEKSGKVGTLPGRFPDMGGKILGAHCTLPDVLTT